eukprot:m.38940 g.38940  ORF g.38940 m.38940 type:complete len:73 (-) comp18043_c0_seq1:227-445(-)
MQMEAFDRTFITKNTLCCFPHLSGVFCMTYIEGGRSCVGVTSNSNSSPPTLGRSNAVVRRVVDGFDLDYASL